jgi:IS1 family transposase
VVPKQRRATAKGETNRVERLNGSLRQRLVLVRRTLSFSKSLEMLEAALTLYFHRYNASS